jgi:2-dehydro-3-deoxyphosphogluconate aldolase / (4S)-4-hydroxy-2-oxoglutarate aldolase
MSHSTVLETITRLGVIPVIAIESVEAALPLADALVAGGLPLVEITFRTAAAAEVIRRIASQRPEVLVGAGTLLTPENVQTAKACGARFGVAPGLNPEVVRQAAALDLPMVPGVATPSEIEQGLSLGSTTLKFFPAGAFGGVDMLKALAGPYAHTGVRFVPTGGVNEKNLAAYASLKSVAAVGGTWIAKPDDIAQGRWPEITQRCRQALEIVAEARGAA